MYKIKNASAISKRETEILKLISKEFTNKEIATYLYISVGTVETHRKNLFMKTGSKNMAGLVTWGFENGVLRVGS